MALVVSEEAALVVVVPEEVGEETRKRVGERASGRWGERVSDGRERLISSY